MSDKKNHGIAVTMKADTPTDINAVEYHLHTDQGGIAFLLIAVGIAEEVLKDERYKMPVERATRAIIEACEDWSDMLNELFETTQIPKQ